MPGVNILDCCRHTLSMLLYENAQMLCVLVRVSWMIDCMFVCGSKTCFMLERVGSSLSWVTINSTDDSVQLYQQLSWRTSCDLFDDAFDLQIIVMQTSKYLLMRRVSWFYWNAASV